MPPTALPDTEQIESIKPTTESPQENLTTEELLSIDEAKRRSGKQPERIMNETNQTFHTCFGLSAEMKALRNIIPPERADFDNTCLEMAEEYHRMKKQNPQDPEVKAKVLVKILREQYDIELEEAAAQAQIDTQGSDRLLDIGSPYVKLASLFGKRVTTIDYEYSEDHQNDSIRSRNEAASQHANGTGYLCESIASNATTPERLKPLLDGRYQEDQKNPTGRGLAQVFNDREELGHAFSAGRVTTEDAIEQLSHLINEMQNLRAQAALVTELAQPKSPFRDPRRKFDPTISDEGNHVAGGLGEIFKDIFYQRTDLEAMRVFQDYEKEVLPGVVYENVEDLMDMLFAKPLNQMDYRVKDILEGSVDRLGMDSKKWDPLQPGARPFDVLQEMIKSPNGPHSYASGFDLLKNLGTLEADELVDAMNRRVTEKMSEINPVKSRGVEDVEIRRMLFPYTQELAPHSFERILASWSFSVRMLPKIPSEQIVEEVWPELDRLLTPEGIAVIFPIGYYINELTEEGKDTTTPEERLGNTLKEYNNRGKGTNLKWEFRNSQDNAIDGASVLVIWKGNVKP